MARNGQAKVVISYSAPVMDRWFIPGLKVVEGGVVVVILSCLFEEHSLASPQASRHRHMWGAGCLVHLWISHRQALIQSGPKQPTNVVIVVPKVELIVFTNFCPSFPASSKYLVRLARLFLISLVSMIIFPSSPVINLFPLPRMSN